MDEEMLYDDVAMENAYGYMNTANGKLAEASGEYSSGELSGINLNDIKDFISKAASLIGKFVSAADNIYEGGDLNFNFSENQGTNGSQGTNINTSEVQSEINLDELTEEQIDEYEAEIQNNLDMCDTMASFYENQANSLNDTLTNFLCTFVGVYAFTSDSRALTPEEYEQWLIERITINPYNEDGSYNPEYLAELEEIKGIVAEYREVFETEFEKATGRNYGKFIEELNNASAIAASARSSKYSLEQQLKEIPYLRMMLTDEYKEFASGEYDLSKVQEILPNHFYYDEETQTMQSFLNEQEQLMVLYLWETQGEDAGWDSIIKYLNAKEDKLNQIRAAKEVEDFLKENMNENGELTLGAFNEFMGEGFVDGIWTFADGIIDIFRTDGMISYTQYKQMYLLAALQEQGNLTSDFLGGLYQNFSTIGNMIIPMLMSGGLGAIGSSILMGASAGGNAKNQALIDGYAAPNAWIYGLCSGMSETVLNYFLGSIPGLSQTSGFTIANFVSEGFEEFTQEWFNAGLRAIIFGEEIDFNAVGIDSLKSFAMGMLVAGQLNGITSGINTIAFKMNGINFEIPFDQIKEICENNPGMTAVEVLTNIIKERRALIDEYRAMFDEGQSTIGLNQNILNIIFRKDGYSITAEGRMVITGILNKYGNEIIENLKKDNNYTTEVCIDIINNLSNTLNDPSNKIVDASSYKMIQNILNNLWLRSKVISYEETSLSDYVSYEYDPNSDFGKVRAEIFKHFASKGMTSDEVIGAFKDYNQRIGGVCTYEAFGNSICESLTEEKFLELFGFEKYVTYGNTRHYNPLLLADMIFEMNKEGNVDTPNFVQQNGKWGITGELNVNPLGTDKMIFDIERANKYLNSKGLEATIIDGIANDMTNNNVNSDELVTDIKDIIDKALSEGNPPVLSIMGEPNKKVTLIGMNGASDVVVDGGHDVKVIGTSEEGFYVVTYGKEFILPYDEVIIYDYQYKNMIKQFSSLGCYVLSISETGG